MIRPLGAAMRAALLLSLVLGALVAASLWWRDQKAPDHRVGQRLRLQSSSRVPVLPRVDLGGETREAWQVEPGEILRFAVTVPGEDATLRFREGRIGGLPELELTLVTASGRRRVLHAGPATGERWAEQRVAVPARAGEPVDLEFRVDGGSGRAGPGAVYVADVVLESAGRAVDESEIPVVTRAVVLDLLGAYGPDQRRAPPVPESRRADLPGPRVLPLPRDALLRVPFDGVPAPEPAAPRLELVLLAVAPEGATVSPATVEILSGDAVVRSLAVAAPEGEAHEMLVALDLPLRDRHPPELGLRRLGGEELFVGVRELVVTGLRAVPRRPFVPGASRNVLLVTVSSLRADRLGAYGYERGATPHLDALAARGVRYAAAFAPSSWALPNVATVYTGTSPVTHGLGLGPDRRLWPRLRTLARRAAWAGRSTAGFSSSTFVSRRRGLDQGAETFALRYLPAPVLVERALDWLVEHEPFEWFLALHLADPAYPHDPGALDLAAVDPVPDPALVERVRRLDSRPGVAEAVAHELGPLYDAEIAAVDRALGRLLDELARRGLLDDTVVVVAGAHGEELFEHGGRLHGQTLYDEVVQVPLIVAGAGIAPDARGLVVDEPVELTDVAVLVAHLAGLEPEGSVQGRLPPPFGVQLGAGPVTAHSLLVPVPDLVRHDLEAARDERWLLVVDREHQTRSLYDRRADPLQQHDLLAQEAPPLEIVQAAAQLELSLQQWYRRGWLTSVPRLALAPEGGP